MSETEHYRGVLTPLNVTDIEKWAEGILKNKKIAAKDYYDSFLEQLEDSDECEDYIVIKNKAYKVKKKDIGTEDDIIEATQLPNGDIEFELRYYNGGCGFGEALEEAMDEIDQSAFQNETETGK